MLDLTIPAVKLCILAAGVFFMSGLLTGVWKYWHIAHSAGATAPVYVDIAHRTSLLYSFAAILLARSCGRCCVLAGINPWLTQRASVLVGFPSDGHSARSVM